MSCFQSDHLIRLPLFNSRLYLHVFGQDPLFSSTPQGCATLSVFYAPVTPPQVCLHARSFCDVHPKRVRSLPIENDRGLGRWLNHVLAPSSLHLSISVSYSPLVVAFQQLTLPIAASDSELFTLAAPLTAGLRGTCSSIWHRVLQCFVRIAGLQFARPGHSHHSRPMSLNPLLPCRYSF